MTLPWGVDCNILSQLDLTALSPCLQIFLLPRASLSRMYLHREVDIGLVLALLLGVANGDAFERIDAVHAVLAWRSRPGAGD